MTMMKIPRPASSCRGAGVILTILLCVLLLADASPTRAGDHKHAMQIGAGAMIPFDTGHRSIYGKATALTLGFSSRISDSDTWITYELGYLRSAGSEFPHDPTFEIDDSKYWLLPISLGVRTSGTRLDNQGLARLYFGIAAQWILSGWEGPFLGSHQSPTVGVSLELRPEFKLEEDWRLWIRQRFTILAGVEYDTPISELNFSGSTLDLGVNYHF